ncbi:universal stress protein [Gordonia sp. NPDC003429]
MSIVVGYVQGEGGLGGVQLGAMLAEAMKTELIVATVVPKPWVTPSPAKVDAEFVQWTDQVVERARTEVTEYMEIYPPDLQWRFQRLDHRTASSALMAFADEVNAAALVISSTGDSQLGQIQPGATADSLLHRSKVPVGISPRGYRSPKDGQLKRVTVALADGGPDAIAVVARARELADRMSVPLRVITFAVRGGAMYPPLVGLSSEDVVLAQWQDQSGQAQQRLRDEGVIDPDTPCLVASGRGWREAFDSAEWIEGEVLFLGSTREGLIAQVFIGSRASKIVRHSPVPVVVLPR